MGPFRMCPPGPLSVTLSTMARRAGWIFPAGTPAPSSRLGVEVIIVVTSTVSPEATRSTGGVFDQ